MRRAPCAASAVVHLRGDTAVPRWRKDVVGKDCSENGPSSGVSDNVEMSADSTMEQSFPLSPNVKDVR